MISTQNSLRCWRHMGPESKLTLLNMFGATSSMFSLIDQNMYILWPTGSHCLLATFGTLKILLFSKVWAPHFCFFLCCWCLQDTRGRLRGESIIKESLRGSYCGFCKWLPVSTVPGASRNNRGLHPIITEGCPWMGWKCSIQVGSLPMHSYLDIGLGICTGQAVPNSLVHCGINTYLTASADIDIAPGPLATDVWATGV